MRPWLRMVSWALTLTVFGVLGGRFLHLQETKEQHIHEERMSAKPMTFNGCTRSTVFEHAYYCTTDER